MAADGESGTLRRPEGEPGALNPGEGGGDAPVFLFVHRGALGDFALTWPTLSRLRERYPSHRFVGVGRPGHLELAIALGLLDAGLDAESSALLPFFQGHALPSVLEDLVRPASRPGPESRALLWMQPDPALESLLRARSVAAVFHPPFAPSGASIHMIDHHLAALGALDAAPGGEVSQELPQHVAGFEFSQASGVVPIRVANRVIVHPGSGSPRKNFSPEFYLRLAERLPAWLGPAPEGGAWDVRFLLGPAEAGAADFFRARRDAGFRAEEPESPLRLAETLASASLFIGNDSGPSHVAALLGTPTLALFRGTDPVVWGVRGRAAASVSASNEADAWEELKNALDSLRFGTKSG